MDEVLTGEAGRMDSPALQDRHPLLHPQQGFAAFDLSEEKSRPSAVPRMRGEQLGEGRVGRRGQLPALAQPAGELANFGRTACAAGDQGKASCHTTHNVLVLLLFLFPRLTGKSQWRDS